MDNLSAYLQKFKKLVGDKSEEKRIVKEVLTQIIHSDISLDQISIRENIVFCTISPIQKTEIILKKKEILFLCKEKGFSFIDFR
jgi:radical SAM superfamily enzyme with C-terminal helix-hairpin-helix motif